MGKIKTKPIEGLPLNYNSTDPKDFIETLNKIAGDMGGVANMGVFADITSIKQSNEMIAQVSDEFIAVSVEQIEKPHRDLIVTTNFTEPYQFDLDTLIGKDGSSLPPSLEEFLNKETPSENEEDEDEDDNEIEEEDDDDDDDDDDEEEDDDDDDDDNY